MILFLTRHERFPDKTAHNGAISKMERHHRAQQSKQKPFGGIHQILCQRKTVQADYRIPQIANHFILDIISDGRNGREIISGKEKILEERVVTVDEKTYKIMQREKRNQPYSAEEMMLYDEIFDEWDD